MTEEKIKTTSKKQGCLSAIIFILVFAVIMVACSDKKKPESNSVQATQITERSALDSQIDSIITQAKEYEILSTSDISNGLRSRWKAFIYSPDAKTKEEQLATAAKAAMDIQVTNRVQYSFVVLFDGRDSDSRSPLIQINFAPDHMDQAGEPMGGRFKVE
jgi:lipopolysaccharide export LptBFGC system permease protein LptF